MAKGRSGGMIGTKYSIPTERALGTPEEIAGRDSEAHQNAPTTFRQIGPSDNTGMNLARADKTANNKSGDFKFSSGPSGR